MTRMLNPTLVLLLAAPLAAAAQGLVDPTRPPAAWGASASASGAVPGAVATRGATAPAVQRWRVLSLHLPRHGSASALLNDRLVRVGDRLGEQQVVAIDAQGVLLRHARGNTERLLLWQPLPADPPPADPAPAPPAGAPGAAPSDARLAKGQQP